MAYLDVAAIYRFEAKADSRDSTVVILYPMLLWAGGTK